MKSIFTFCVLWFLSTTIAYPQNNSAQKIDLKFEHIGTVDGLSQSTVSCMLQDSKGFMWFGTQDGLNKYDGYSFTSYHFDPADSSSILGNYIFSIIEDSKGNLWIGTESGLNMFDQVNNTFVRYQHDEDDPSSLSGTEVRAILEDSEGRLWVGSTGGDLARLDRNTGKFVHFRHDVGDPERLSEDIYSIYEDSSKKLWVGSFNGNLSLFDREKESFIPVYYQGEKLSNNRIWNITGDREGIIWISTYRDGLYSMGFADDGSPELVHYVNDIKDAGSISSNFIITAFEDSNGQLWIGTENGGLILFDRENEKFITHRSDPFNENSLNSNSIWSIFEDKTGNLWVGTFAGGINLHTKYGKYFDRYKHIPGNKNSLSPNSVTSFSEDSQGKIWIGTDGGGINQFDRRTGNFLRYNSKNSKLGSDAVLSSFEDSRGNLWVGTWGGGLNLFDRESHTFRRYTTENSGLASNQIFSIIEDRRGVLWITSFYGGLNYFDRESNSFINYTPENSQISDNQIRMILEDSFGVLWVCAANGLNAFDPETETFTIYSHDDNKSNSLSKGYVLSVLEAADSSLWIGTSGGLNKFDRQQDTFTSYHISDGLPSSMIKSIEEDDQGNIWLSTNRGLSRLNPATGEFSNYDHSDGLQDDEFYQGSSYKLPSGEIFFGGVNGFNVFLPEGIISNPYIPSVVITDFQIFNKPAGIGENMPLQTHISEAEQITLSYKQNVFSFEFTALNYISSEKNQYAYKLDGFDLEWSPPVTHHSASYTNLDPGEYTFRVKASNNDGLWNEEGASVKVVITPPFWKTLGFKIVGILLVVVTILLIFYIRLRQIINRNKNLNEQVIERTKEIKQKNTMLEEQTDELKAQRDELKSQRDVLEAQRDELDATNSVKDRLFSIISHDLRSPFNTLKGFIELIQLRYDGYTDKEVKDMIEIISGSADTMYNLLDNLLSWSRSQKGTLKLHPRRTNLAELINAKIELLNQQAANKNILIDLGCEADGVFLELDSDLMNVVIQNLLGNAIKFTPKGGKIEVNCTLEKDQLIVYVRDNGVGISEEDAEKLFDPNVHFSTSGTEKEKGTGLGMIICKDFVALHHGEIWVESESGKGSTFFIKLPLTQS